MSDLLVMITQIRHVFITAQITHVYHDKNRGKTWKDKNLTCTPSSCPQIRLKMERKVRRLSPALYLLWSKQIKVYSSKIKKIKTYENIFELSVLKNFPKEVKLINQKLILILNNLIFWYRFQVKSWCQYKNGQKPKIVVQNNFSGG